MGELLFAICMAVLFTLVFALGFNRPGPWAAWWAFFLVILLAAWAGGLWISPAGPVFIGMYWLPVILVAFIFALLLAAVTPRGSRSSVETISEVRQQEAKAERAFDVFFWVLIISLAAVILLGYLAPAGEVVVTTV